MTTENPEDGDEDFPPAYWGEVDGSPRGEYDARSREFLEQLDGVMPARFPRDAV